MKREAKDETFKELTIDHILSGTSFSEVPSCVCPIDSFPEMMSTVFCTTKCYSPCTNFRSFSFIIDVCNEENCGISSPCSSCMKKVEEYKEIMMKLKAVFPNRNTDKFVNHRVQQYIDWCNGLRESSLEAKQRKEDGF